MPIPPAPTACIKLEKIVLGQLIVSGVSQGAIYAFIALSLTLIFRTTTVVNFGQGELFMGAAFAIYIGVVVFGLPYPVAALLSLAGMFLVGLAIERNLIRPMMTGPHLSVAMMTIAIGFILRGVVRYIWGREVLPMPSFLSFDPLVLGSVVITTDDIVIVGTVSVALGLFFLGFYKTTLGRLAQAMYQSARGARLIGVNVDAFSMSMWGLGALMAALAGILVAPVTLLYPDMGANALIRGFAAMTLGGFGSLHGAVIGGLLLGLLEQIAGAYLSTVLIDITGYIVIILVLVLRPNGLFGRANFTRV
jgi:branched-chain amino acid transport system permease protein